MKIALLHYAAPPIVGGVENVLAAHANLLADAGHTVQVIAARGGAWRDDVRFTTIPLADSMHATIREAKAALDEGIVPPAFTTIKDELIAQLRAATAGDNVLVAHNVASLNKNLPLTAALHDLSQEQDTPALVIWHHDLAWTTPRYRAELHDGYPWSLLRTAWPGVTQVVVSRLRQRELADLMQMPQDAVQVVPNGIDIATFFKLEPFTQSLVEELDLLQADPLLLLPVRLTPRKNVELALRITAAMRATMPAARLLVSGPMGPHNPANLAYFARLRALRDELGLGAQALFLAERSQEFVPDAVIADLYRLADALLFPSREEGFGIPMLEAGLSHLPIFAADIPPLRELGGDDVTWFDADADPAHVARQIAERLQSSGTQNMAVRARTYTWQSIYQQRLEPLLRAAIGARTARLRESEIPG